MSGCWNLETSTIVPFRSVLYFLNVGRRFFRRTLWHVHHQVRTLFFNSTHCSIRCTLKLTRPQHISPPNPPTARFFSFHHPPVWFSPGHHQNRPRTTPFDRARSPLSTSVLHECVQHGDVEGVAPMCATGRAHVCHFLTMTLWTESHSHGAHNEEKLIRCWTLTSPIAVL